MKIKHLFLAVLLVSLTACGTAPVAQPPAYKPPPEPTIAPSLTKVRCPDLDLVPDPAPIGVAMKYITALQTSYITCATRMDSLQDAATKK